MRNPFFHPPAAKLRGRDAASGKKIIIEIGSLFGEAMVAIYIGPSKEPT